MIFRFATHWLERVAGRRKTVEQTIAAIADRVLLGAATFVTGVLVGRGGTPQEFGAYTLGMTIVFFAIAVQESLLSAPYTVNSRDFADGAQRRYLGSVFVHLMILSGALAVALLAAAAVCYSDVSCTASEVLLTLGLVIPAVLVREFARRIDYADLRPRNAVLLSGGVSAFQLVLTFALFMMGRLHAASALAVVGVASSVGAVAWLFTYLKRMEFDARDVTPAFKKNVALGGWIFATQLSEMARVQALPWLLAAIIDTAAAGLYAACYAISSLASPLIVAVSNIVVPQIAHQLQEGGVRAVEHFVVRTTAWLTAALAGYGLVLAATSSFIVQWVYGDEYVNTTHTLNVMAAAQVLLAFNLPAARALMVLKRADLAFWSQLAGVVPTIALGPLLVNYYGPLGAAYAFLAGAVVKVATTHWPYRAEIKRGLATDLASEVATPRERTSPQSSNWRSELPARPHADFGLAAPLAAGPGTQEGR